VSRDIVVVGGSAGGLEPLRSLGAALPPDLAAAVFVVVHGSPATPGVLPDILNRVGSLLAAFASEGEAIERGRIYVAPPDRHLLIGDGRMRVSSGPRENGFRPAVDPLFRTAARNGRSRVIGVVLSGSLNDGTSGLAAIKQHGGVALVQDPAEAIIPSMPASAIRAGAVDHVLPAAQLGTLIGRLVEEAGREGARAMRRHGADDVDPAVAGTHGLEGSKGSEPPSPFRCPECGGALWEGSGAASQSRFTCHVGHAFTDEGLLDGRAREVEASLWVAVRALEEQAALHRRMAVRAHRHRVEAVAQLFEEKAVDAERRARMIRRVLLGQKDEVSDRLPQGGSRGGRGRDAGTGSASVAMAADEGGREEAEEPSREG